MNVANHFSLGVTMFVPDEILITKKARAVLPGAIPTTDAAFNVGRAAFLVTALMWGHWEEIGPAMQDRLHQPYRSKLIPQLDAVIDSALGAGAYGAALSGGGPSVIALGPPDHAEAVGTAMQQTAAAFGWSGSSMMTSVRRTGVQVKEL